MARGGNVTVLGVDGAVELVAPTDGEHVILDAASLEAVTGFTLKPEGLCRGAVCVPVRDPAALECGGGLDLAAVATVLAAPCVVDVEAGVAAVGEPASLRSAAMDTVDAPDFTLADFAGGTFTLSSLRGKKKLLVTWASW
jgi:hypothetical protein